MRPNKNGFYWFTWGPQAPHYDEDSVVWMPALVRDGRYLPLGDYDKDIGIVPRANIHRSMMSVSDTEHYQWGEEIIKRR